MFLRRLQLTDIRSIQNLSIDFTAASGGGIRQWTCLLGENGCGKSTILRAAALVLAGSEALPDIMTEAGRWVRQGQKKGRIEAIIETQDGEQRTAALDFVPGMGISQFLKLNEKALEQIDAALSHSSRSYFVAGYGVSRRLPSRSRSFESPEIFSSVRTRSFGTLFSGDASLRSLDGWAMDLHYRKGASGLTVIRRAIKDLLPDAKFHRVDKKSRQLIFKTKDGLIPLEELSDGYQNVAAWCGDLLYRITEVFQNYSNPLKARGLLLLDEVDLHLHPVWQRQLVQTLVARLPNFQILTTTHSPLTAQQAGEGELYILRRVADRPTLFHYEAAPNLLRVEQLLVSPIFGLETGASVKVENLRVKRAQGRRLSSLEAEVLEQVPRRNISLPMEREKLALLREVKSALASVKQRQPIRVRAAGTAGDRHSASEIVTRALRKK